MECESGKKTLIEMRIKDDRHINTKFFTHFTSRISWRLVNGLKEMSLICNDASWRGPLWSCNTKIKIQAIEPHQDSKDEKLGKEHVVEWDFQSSNEKYTLSVGDIISAEELENASNNLELRWELEIISVFGGRPSENWLNFRVRNDDADQAIIVDGTVLYVNKTILSLSSSYFKALFENHTVEKNQGTIEIEGVHVNDFICLLRYLYPSSRDIIDCNIGIILKLAHKFNCNFVIDACEKVLISNANRKFCPARFMQVLRYADQYSLASVQDYCIGKIQCFCQIRQLATVLDYSLLKIETKVALYEKALNSTEKCVNHNKRVRFDSMEANDGRDLNSSERRQEERVPYFYRENFYRDY